MDRTVRIGIIGCGGIANGKHLPSLKKIKNVKLVAFCDIIKERAVKAAEEKIINGELDVKSFFDFENGAADYNDYVATVAP